MEAAMTKMETALKAALVKSGFKPDRPLRYLVSRPVPMFKRADGRRFNVRDAVVEAVRRG